MSQAFSVVGMAKVIKNLKKASDGIKNVARKEMQITARVDGETWAKNKLTGDGHIDTGRLRSSIHVEDKNVSNFSYKDKTGNTFDGKFLGKIDSEDELLMGTNVDYSVKIERIDPFIKPAGENMRAKYKTNVAKAMKKHIKNPLRTVIKVVK